MKGRVPAGLLSSGVPAPKPAVAWDRTFKVERAAITRNLAAEKKAGEEFAKKLVSLGYLSGASAASPVAAGTGSGDVRMTPFGVSNIGVFYAESGRVKEAVPWFEKAIAADPKTPTFHSNLADAYEKLGRMDAADAEALKAAEYGGEDANDMLLARREADGGREHGGAFAPRERRASCAPRGRSCRTRSAASTSTGTGARRRSASSRSCPSRRRRIRGVAHARPHAPLQRRRARRSRRLDRARVSGRSHSDRARDGRPRGAR